MKINRKGFTLVELLAVFVIMGLLMTIATTFIIDMSDRAKEESYTGFKNIITTAVHSYIIDNNMLNSVKTKSCSEPIKIKISTLISKNYLSKNDLKNPKTNKSVNVDSSYVKVYYGYRFEEFEDNGTCITQDGQDYDYRYYVNIVDNN